MLVLKLNNFEGSLKLLLERIEKQEIDIKDISLSEVTEQCLQYTERLSDLDDMAEDNILLTARLLYLKSQAYVLFEKDENYQENEEEVEGFEEGEELIKHQEEYQKFKELSDYLKSRGILKSYPRGNTSDFQDIMANAASTELSPDKLVKAFIQVLARRQDEKEYSKKDFISQVHLTVTEGIEILRQRINYQGIMFTDIFSSHFTKLDLVVIFFALLELVRLGEVGFSQESRFGGILVYLRNPSRQETG